MDIVMVLVFFMHLYSSKRTWFMPMLFVNTWKPVTYPDDASDIWYILMWYLAGLFLLYWWKQILPLYAQQALLMERLSPTL